MRTFIIKNVVDDVPLGDNFKIKKQKVEITNLMDKIDFERLKFFSVFGFISVLTEADATDFRKIGEKICKKTKIL